MRANFPHASRRKGLTLRVLLVLLSSSSFRRVERDRDSSLTLVYTGKFPWTTSRASSTSPSPSSLSWCVFAHCCYCLTSIVFAGRWTWVRELAPESIRPDGAARADRVSHSQSCIHVSVLQLDRYCGSIGVGILPRYVKNIGPTRVRAREQ